MTLAGAKKAARRMSARSWFNIFVVEYLDTPGSFAAVSEREYNADVECGEWFREAVAEFSNGAEVFTV